jgi:hypothetical protein
MEHVRGETMQRWLAVIVAFVLAGCAAATPAGAQQGQAADEPPLIAGRVAVADGDAQIWRTEDENSAGQWDNAIVNDVVSAGTGLYTGSDGRNEVRVGPNTFRLAAASRGGFTRLDYSTASFDLEYGTLNVRLARPERGETTSVTVAGLRIDLVAPGRYRVDASDQGPMRLTVFEGHGTVRSASNATGVSSGQAIVVNPGGAGFSFEQPIVSAFDQWALERDAQYQQVRSTQFVSPYMTGYEELDVHGDWSSDASFGVVWFPRAVPVGWAPYRFGQWRWIRPWGWTWVDFAPWGYAPFHYGRWVMVGPRWGWVPGGYVRQPVWAPALVGFVGTGVSVSVGIGAPVVGWYPLAPWHRYEPHYRHSPRYVTIINQTIINQPPRGVPRDVTQGPGTTMVPGPRFREPIHRVAMPVPPKPQDLQPAAPPPLNVAPAPRSPTPRFSDNDGRPGSPKSQMAYPPQPPAQLPAQSPVQSPGQASPGAPPTRVMPPMAADPMPGRGVTPPPPLPGNDPAPLRQPPGLNKVQPAPQSPAPAAPQPPRATPRPHLPSDQIPPGQPQPVNPAEPPRFPPGAPPTIRQPPPMAPAARTVQPSPSAQAPATRVVPPPEQAAPPRHAPPAAAHPTPARPTPPAAVPAPAPSAPVAVPQPKPHPAPSPKEQVLRGSPEQERGKPPEREAPPPRARQADR